MKPRVLSFIYANGFKPEGDVGNAIGILNTIKLGKLPNLYSFYIIVILQGVDSEVINKLKIEFYDVSQNKLLFGTETVDIPPFNQETSDPLPKDAHILNFQLDFRNVRFEEQGWHKTVILFNDKLIHEAFIFVAGKKE